jgi:hypothetical protein
LPTLQDWLQDVANVWPVVLANRATLIPILVSIVVFEWVILSFWYSGRLASKEAEIRLQARQLADHRVTSPAEAKARIEALEQWLRRFEPRQLTDDQQKILIDRARVHEHQELTIIFETGSDCATYATAFEATLREAGWNVHNWQIANPPRRPMSGIAVQVPDLNNIPREAELLRTALVAAHIDIELINMKDFPPKSPVQLLITATASSLR